VIQKRKAELEMLTDGKTLDVDELGRRRRVAFLDLLLLIARDGSLSDADIREEVDTFMFEGHDTTAAAISFTAFLLSRHPAVQEKILGELEAIFDCSKPLEPSIQELSQLKYLEMVIKESMRIYPPVSGVARQISSDLRLESSTLTVPSGATLFLNFYFLHRNPELFPYPERFDPERFTQEETVRRKPFSYLPFSAGSRQLHRVFMWLKWLLVAAVTPLSVLWKLLRLRIHQVRLVEKIDGARAYTLVGNAMRPKTLSARNIYVYFLHISKVYGKTSRFYLGPLAFVYTMEIKDLETLLSRPKYIEKNFMYKLLRPWLGTGLLSSGGEKWQQRRKLLTPAFHLKILEQFVPVFNSCGEEFVRQLRRRADGNVFNVFPLVELLTLDVICGRLVSNVTVARIFKPWYFFDSIFMISPTGREYKKCLKVIHETTDKVIRERRSELELINGENNILDEEEIGRRRRLAFLDLLLLSARDGSLTDADIREEVDTFMFEDHIIPESCSISLSPYTVHRDPEVFPESERFIPERFSPEEIARRNTYAYIPPFSAGPRNCIAFHFKILEQFIPVINNCGEEFVKQLRRHADGKVFDVFHPVQLLTLDIICESAMGVTVNAQIDSNSNYSQVYDWSPNLSTLVLSGLHFSQFAFWKGIQESVIQERKTEIESMNGGNITLDVDGLGRRRRLAFLDLLLLSARDGSLSDADIREEVDTFMFAGQDTTAAAISYTIFLLSRHTDVQENILDELKSIFDPQQPLRPSLQQLSELKYLEMVVKESLRLYPPVPHFNRWNPEDTKLACGQIMPQGSSISIVPYSLHRDPEVFPEPERFIPERFSPEESARRHPYAYIPFSAGPRNCIGQRFAMLEMKSVLAKVVWNFHLLPAPDFEPELSWEIILVSILDQFVPVFNSNGEEFIRQLRKRADGRAFDIWPLSKLLTLDVICETIMGVRVNAQTNSNSPYVKAVNDISTIIIERALRPWELSSFIFRFSKLGRRHQQCLDVLHGTTDKVIQERKAELDKLSEGKTLDVDELGRRRRVAFLDLLLLIARDGSLSDADIREEVDTFMFEGHDTTAAAISFTAFLLSRHPAVQEQILEELETIFDSSKPLEPSIQELSELKYLEMVIKESLRIYPPVCVVARQINSDLPLESSTLTIPAGTTLFLNFYLLHRDPEVFPDYESFDPERFTPEQTVRRNPFSYLPFSAGSRNCIGQRFAMLELKSIMAKLVWNFRILPDPNYEPELVWELILKSQNGISRVYTYILIITYIIVI
ncbi:Cytochrome P450 4C1, partial [Gryllus bimaculatus]